MALYIFSHTSLAIELPLLGLDYKSGNRGPFLPPVNCRYSRMVLLVYIDRPKSELNFTYHIPDKCLVHIIPKQYKFGVGHPQNNKLHPQLAIATGSIIFR